MTGADAGASEQSAPAKSSVMLFCKSCLDLGHSCTATHEAEDGSPICVFCLDSVLCPVQRKRQKFERQQSRDPESDAPIGADRVRSREPEQMLEAKMETTTRALESSSVRTCAHPDCDAELGPLNKSGKCAKHWHWKGAPKGHSSAGNGHAAAGSNGANGHAHAAGNGTAQLVEIIPELSCDLVEDRLNRLIASMTVAEKTRIATAWLSGKI